MVDENLINEIPNSQNAIITVMREIQADTGYQEIIQKLPERAQNRVKLMEDIRVYGDANQPLFLARDIGILMGVSSISSSVKTLSNEDDCVVWRNYTDPRGRVVKAPFLTKYGVYMLGFTSKNSLARLCRKYIINLVEYVRKNMPQVSALVFQDLKAREPELVEDAEREFKANYEAYEQLYYKELQEKIAWMNKAEQEYLEKKELEKEKAYAEIELMYGNIMVATYEDQCNDQNKYIAELRGELMPYMYDNSSKTVNKELVLLKKQYWKPIVIWAIIPDALYEMKYKKTTRARRSGGRVGTRGGARKSKLLFSDEEDVETKVEVSDEKVAWGDINNEEYLEAYSIDFKRNSIVEKDNGSISAVVLDDHVDIFMCLSFGYQKIKKSELMIQLTTEYVPSRPKFNELINTMCKELTCYNMGTDTSTLPVFKTDLNTVREYIHSISFTTEE